MPCAIVSGWLESAPRALFALVTAPLYVAMRGPAVRLRLVQDYLRIDVANISIRCAAYAAASNRNHGSYLVCWQKPS